MLWIRDFHMDRKSSEVGTTNIAWYDTNTQMELIHLDTHTGFNIYSLLFCGRLRSV